MKNKGSLVRTIFISMITTAVVSILLLGIVFIQHAYQHFNEESRELREEYIEAQKATIKNEVEKVVDYIEYMRSKQMEGLKDSLKTKADHAYDIALNIYNENKGNRNRQEIEKMVKDVLRPIRYNNDRVYYFAIGLDGTAELVGEGTELEGKNLLNILDEERRSVVKDMIGIASAAGEGVVEYAWKKPDHEDKDFKKLSHVRLFEPFNWIIGIGDYFDDNLDNVKKLVLDRIAEIRFGDDGYIFVVTYEGVTLMNDTQRDLIGKNIWDLTDPDGIKVIQQERMAVENPEGGFIHYKWSRPGASKPVPKITFMKAIPDWEWMIGAGVYVDHIDDTIIENRKSLSQQVINHLIKVSLFLLFLIAATYLTAKFIARRIDKSIVTFSSFFQRASVEAIKIDMKGVNFSEFEALALSANRMIDQREEAERSLRENEEKYRTLFNMESDALALIDVRTGGILDVNEAFCHLFGFAKKEALNMKEDDFSGGFNETGEILKIDSEYIPVVYKKKKNGALFPAEINTRDFEYQGSGVRLLAVRDISDRKRLEEQLRQAQKMEAIGTLAGGIAHDFNNILFPILGHAEMLMMGLPPDSHIQYNLRQIYEAGNRAKDMIRQILAFSRKDRQEKKPVSMGSVIEDTLKFLRGSIPTTIDLEYVNKSGNDFIMANSTQIHQVILNLCANAAHAMRENGGQIEIEVDDFSIDGLSPDKYQRLSGGRYIRIRVKDTGTGIDPAIISNIFDPYFTTKNVGEGTGMGLAVVHGIVTDHKGDITVESEPGKGAAFTILLPSYDYIDVQKAVETSDHAVISKGHERILLVDDDKIVADVLQEMLMSLGYEVTTRTSSVEALEAFRNNPHRFDLVITDMTMPNMIGKDLAMEILSIRPDTPIILSTGFSEQIDEDSAKAAGIKAFIMKPVVINELASAIKSVLDS
ncbi:MAG: cache domain-containing protein [Deltaproteobacteria bacterium]|nr:cache domain-containing protein [Deltaproteobacteria bacterium]